MRGKKTAHNISMENISTPERKITIGATILNCGSDTLYGGEANLKENQKLREFLAKHWNTNKCEEGKYY
ncbi:hypothetical protein OOZ15_08955 [Galbibacter sp. EGI 63066]|uniref:hypothetical protein n=1 Tax=Galbibacter sp. EGI 63066 TaxID=2993559 RepID=UPI0022496480|nr:hypothetical protein [Galbibacter sp. EGI 63066]MCX2680064.1 hypothetical protein [Galbibacter sp. EGI 63066]